MHLEEPPPSAPRRNEVFAVNASSNPNGQSGRRDAGPTSPPPALRFETLEKLTVRSPVDRLTYMSELCRDKVVLDIGCLDETALVKRDTQFWLHGRIAELAREVIGVDSSAQIPEQGIRTSARSVIHRGDATAIDPALIRDRSIETVVAGEFIEHVPDALHFLVNLRGLLPGCELILSTPNGVSFANSLLGSIGREAQHPDHLANFSFKILHTICTRAGFPAWEITPYCFFATEMILTSSGMRRVAARGAQTFIRAVERAFPLLSFGYVVRTRL